MQSLDYSPLSIDLKFSKEDSPKPDEEKEHMAIVPYVSAVGNMMYVMVCTRPDIYHAVGFLIWFMANPGEQHLEIVK